MHEDFDAAVSDYRELLKKCGCLSRIIWVTPEDVLFTRSPTIYVRLVSQGRAAEARREYEAGLARKLGVEFLRLCQLGDASCCFVWFPRDQAEAQRMLMPADGTLKMSVIRDSSNRIAHGIRNGFPWGVLKLRYGKNAGIYGYPFGDSSGLVARVIS